MEELIKKLKKKLEKVNSKDFINNLFIFLVILIIFLIGMNIMFGNMNKELDSSKNSKPTSFEYDYNTELENRLKNILQKFKGVGEVNVMITLEDSVEKIHASNTTKTVENTKETDSEGGVREVAREDTNIQVINSQTGTPITIKEINPTIKGVIVVAEGADDPIILEKLYEAVKTVLGINGNKVQIYSSN